MGITALFFYSPSENQKISINSPVECVKYHKVKTTHHVKNNFNHFLTRYFAECFASEG